MKLSFALEEMRKKNPYFGQKKGSTSRFKYNLRHGRVSPVGENGNVKLRLFDTLTQDMKRYKTQRKQQSVMQDSNQSEVHLNLNPSTLSVKRKQSVLENEFDRIWTAPFNIVVMKDGSDLLDKNTKSIRVDISKFIRKYKIEPPKFIAQLPQEFIVSQMKFFE